MNRPSLELADIFKKFDNLLDKRTPTEYKVIRAIKNCRTDALGGHQLSCNQCEFKKNAYNSCRNRHCPKCQFLSKVKWVEKRKEDLLPCTYFHVVFTLPSELRRLVLQNKELCYNLLFKTSSETLKEVAKTSKNLGAEIGFIGVLHTWSQNLIDHPHVHYIIPNGGLSSDKSKWVKGRGTFFLSIKVLSEVFKAKFIKNLKNLYQEKRLTILGSVEHLQIDHLFDDYLNTLASKDWCIYAKKPFLGPEQVINYLGSYTHRIAISNYRLVKVENEVVTFKVRDNDNPGKSKLMSLHVKEFMRRFLLHVLPKGFVKIRHFGILGNRYRKEKIKLIRELENIIESLCLKESLNWSELLKKVTGVDIHQCPNCNSGELIPGPKKDNLLNTS